MKVDIDYTFLIKEATKAPSAHNSQPWLFKITNNGIEIIPNYKRALPIVDSDNRELFISLGCALENLYLASLKKQYKTLINIDDDGRINIDIYPNENKNKSMPDEDLFDQISLLQTNRSIYDGSVISNNIIDELKSIKIEKGVSIYTYEKGKKEFEKISNLITKGNKIQMNDEKFKNELKGWMRFNKKHSESTNDGLSYAVFSAPNLPKFIAKLIINYSINEKSQIKNDIKKIKSASHFVLFTTQNNTIEEWINLGRTLQRFTLKSEKLGISHSYFNQPNEINELSIELRDILQLGNEYTAMLLRIGYGKKAPYSKRLPLEDIILKTDSFSDNK